MKNYVFDIQRFCLNDGPGIRTVVFLKGCPLDCIWCHNPESKQRERQILFDESLCIGCGKCVELCGQRAIRSIGDIDEEKCTLCGDCAEGCDGAIEISGREVEVDEVLKRVLSDKAFYDNSGGGLTISGGEPLYSPHFTEKLLRAAKECGIHTCLETSGFSPWEDLELIAEYVDLFLFDIKESDPLLHKKYTGADNRLILQNLSKLNEIGADIILRCPIIPGFNDREEHFKNIARLSNENENVWRVEILPYHPLGRAKSKLIGKGDQPNIPFPTEEQISRWIQTISRYTNKEVIKA